MPGVRPRGTALADDDPGGAGAGLTPARGIVTADGNWRSLGGRDSSHGGAEPEGRGDDKSSDFMMILLSQLLCQSVLSINPDSVRVDRLRLRPNGLPSRT